MSDLSSTRNKSMLIQCLSALRHHLTPSYSTEGKLQTSRSNREFCISGSQISINLRKVSGESRENLRVSLDVNLTLIIVGLCPTMIPLPQEACITSQPIRLMLVSIVSPQNHLFRYFRLPLTGILSPKQDFSSLPIAFYGKKYRVQKTRYFFIMQSAETLNSPCWFHIEIRLEKSLWRLYYVNLSAGQLSAPLPHAPPARRRKSSVTAGRMASLKS